MALFKRDDVLSRLKAKVAAGQPIVGGGAGTGFVRVPGEDPMVIYEAAEGIL